MNPEGLDFLLNSWLSSFILVLARVLGFMQIGPVVSESRIPVLVRLGFAFILTIIISPLIKAAPKDYHQYNYFLNLAINLLVGILIGFLVRLVLDIAYTAGEIMDNELGISSASLLDPVTREPTPILSQFFRNFATVLFLNVGGFELTIIALIKSFKLFPLTSLAFGNLGFTLDQVVHLTGQVLIIGIIGASPVLVVLIFMDIVLSVISRAAPKIRPSDLSFTLKPLAGLLIIMFIIPLLREKIIQILLEGVQLFG